MGRGEMLKTATHTNAVLEINNHGKNITEEKTQQLAKEKWPISTGTAQLPTEARDAKLRSDDREQGQTREGCQPAGA